MLSFSQEVVSDSLRPHGLQHARVSCPLLSLGACQNSCLLSQWCHSTISSSVGPSPPAPWSFPALGSFPKNWLSIRWPKYWSFSISPSNEYLGLISFRINWLDFLAVQGALKSLLQHHNLKASILWHSAEVQASHMYMTTGKTVALTIQIFITKCSKCSNRVHCFK